MTAPPKVWVLLGRGVGGNGQMLSLADALGWPYDVKKLVHSFLSPLPNLILGPSLLSLDKRRSSPLVPPWPDLVIGASRRSVPVARWIRRKSGGRTRLVHLLHVQAPLSLFDLILTLPQYRLPERANLLHLAAPLNRIPAERLREASQRFARRFRDLPSPHIALLVGGNSSSYRFDPETAERLGREVAHLARLTSGSVLATTSPRTPSESSRALFAALDCPAYKYQWRPDDPENPYHAYLALADRFVVTADSASLMVEACTTGKPVEVFDWPPRRPLDYGAAAARTSAARFSTQVRDGLVYAGLIKPRRDFGACHRTFRERGLISRLGEPASPEASPLDDMERAVARIQGLFSSMEASLADVGSS